MREREEAVVSPPPPSPPQFWPIISEADFKHINILLIILTQVWWFSLALFCFTSAYTSSVKCESFSNSLTIHDRNTNQHRISTSTSFSSNHCNKPP